MFIETIAKSSKTCCYCRKRIRRGHWIVYTGISDAWHSDCYSKDIENTLSPEQLEKMRACEKAIEGMANAYHDKIADGLAEAVRRAMDPAQPIPQP